MTNSNQISSSSSAQLFEHYEMEKPISIAGPSKFDLERNIELEKVDFFFFFTIILTFFSNISF